MQITIQGSGRRIRFTKSEVKILKAAQHVVTELQRMQAYAGASVAGILARIDDKGNYTEPTTEAAK